MAQNYLQFSCSLSLGDNEQSIKATSIYETMLEKRNNSTEDTLDFALEADDSNPGELWIYANESGNPDDVIEFIAQCSKELSLSGFWGFSWAFTCSKPRLNEFGGGAVVIDLSTGEVVSLLDSNSFVHDVISEKTKEAETQIKES